MCKHITSNMWIEYSTKEIIDNFLKNKKSKFIGYDINNLVCKKCEEVIFTEHIEIY